MSLLDRLLGRLSTRDLLSAINHRTIRMETTMSADRDFLLELAQDLNDLAAPVDQLIADNAAKDAQIEELRGEVTRLGGEVGDLQAAAAADEAGDLDAAQPARAALENIRGKFAAKPDLPDIVVPETPAEPVVEEPVVDEPAPVDPEAPAEPETPADEQA